MAPATRTAHPTAAWVWRRLIEATAWGPRPRYVLRDRDAVHGRDFAAMARAVGIETLLTPFRSPRANALAERWVRTVREDGLDWLLILSARHLEQVLQEYECHDNRARPHRSLALRAPLARGQPSGGGGAVVRRDRLGGLIHEYERAAA